MAPIVSTIEVDCTPEETFSYVTDPSRFGEWQKGVVSGHMDGEGQTTVGSKCITTRRIGFAERPVTSEVMAIDPPREWAVHGIDGPIRATVNVSVEPLDEGARSRVTITLDFEGHGIGKVLVPLVVRREAQKEMPGNLRQLKQHLESGA
jgi:carbon monoxide dehydrogenase subunit G